MRKSWERLVVVSNRLPIKIEREKSKSGFSVKSAVGGLTTALTPVMEKNGGLWIGWPGPSPGRKVGSLIDGFNRGHTFTLKSIPLTQADIDGYYHGFSNETIWPLFHDLLGRCAFDQKNWESYCSVNRRFGKTIAGEVREGDLIWIQDYHLMLVAGYLRKQGVTNPLAFFLHIPFPSLDLFRRLPWKREIIEALMEYDLLGFQTLRDRRNFVQCVKGLIPQVGLVIRRRYTLIRYKTRTVKVGNYPVSIDYSEFETTAKSKEVEDAAWYLHENLHGRQLILGVDRLDYTKGIPERFLAFERALDKYADLHGKVSLVQILVPSRTHVQEYQELKEELDGIIGRINGKYSRHGWVPIHYMFRALDRTQLVGHYRATEIALITPLRDGMNLVAKEYCASTIDDYGVLILSEFAGAAEQMGRGALIVNPYDLEGTADAIYRAFAMEPEKRKRRMRALRAGIRQNNVYRWVEMFLEAYRSSESSGIEEAGEERPASGEIPDMDVWMEQRDVGEEKQ